MPKDDEVVDKPVEVQPPAKVDPTEEPEFKTPEDDAFEEVQAEIAAEEEAAKAGGDLESPDNVENKENADAIPKAVEPEPGAAPAASGQADPEAGDGEGDQTMVPVAAVHEARKNLRDSELQRARLEGMLAASQQQVQQGQTQPQGQPVPPQPSPEEQIAALDAQVDALWQKADDGELTLSEVRKQERAIEGQIRTINQGQAQAPVQPQGQQAPQLDATIEQNLVQLEATYPVITGLTEVQMAQFVQQAYETAKAEGKPFGDGALETMRLHNLAAKHAHDHYGKFYRQPAPAAAPATPQPQTPAQTPGGGLSLAAQARAAKMDFQAAHPPNINQLGTTAEGQLSDEQINSKMEGMSEDEQIEFLETMPGLAKRLGVTMSGPQ